MERVYFPTDPVHYVRRKVKEELKWGLKRKSLADKSKDFLQWAHEVVGRLNLLNHFSEINNYFIINTVIKNSTFI